MGSDFSFKAPPYLSKFAFYVVFFILLIDNFILAAIIQKEIRTSPILEVAPEVTSLTPALIQGLFALRWRQLKTVAHTKISLQDFCLQLQPIFSFHYSR